MKIKYERFDRFGRPYITDRINDFLKENEIHLAQVINLSEDDNWITLWYWSDKE